jgi:hypothetical protein
MARLIPNVHSLRHVEAALDHDLDGDDVSDAARGDFEHDPSDDCGCDRCATTRQELNERYDALCDAIDDGELVFERDRAVPHAGLYGDAQVFRGWVCLAGTPSNEACDPGEVA